MFRRWTRYVLYTSKKNLIMTPVKQFLTLKPKTSILLKCTIKKRWVCWNYQNVLKLEKLKWHSNVNILEKRSFSTTAGSKIDRTRYEWLKTIHFRNFNNWYVHIAFLNWLCYFTWLYFLGPWIRAKATEIAVFLGNTSSHTSSVWLEKFRTRHNTLLSKQYSKRLLPWVFKIYPRL